jgi:two-component system, NarL family, sensor kinase
MRKGSFDIVIFLVIVSVLIITMLIFILSIVYLYRKKRELFGKSIEDLRLQHERTILDSRLEIQEQTFQHISREIHDNINLSLTLVKLNLNTLQDSPEQINSKVESSVNLLSKCITELSNISQALNADIIIQQGLIQSIKDELSRIMQASKIDIFLEVTGEPVFLLAQKELIIFRIIQEAFNNILKHSNATNAYLGLDFNDNFLQVKISDKGKGFDNSSIFPSRAGLRNMETRAKILGGTMDLNSKLNKGTTVSFKIPYEYHAD